MRLRNKKTGDIYELNEFCLYDDKGFAKMPFLKSLAELNAEWEDVPEEPKEYWAIDCFSTDDELISQFGKCSERIIENRKQIGNYFETKEEAEKAIEKLKAWKRLKDKGFRFDDWEDLQAEMGADDLMLFNRDIINTDNVIGFRMDDYHDCIKDLNILFGGEE